LRAVAEPFLERRSNDAAAARLDGPPLAGLARALGSGGDAARYLSVRPALLERIASADPGSLAARAAQLEADPGPPNELDLETFLDGLRLLRRDETLFAACLDLAGLAPFEQVSGFLSVLAERIVCAALERAEQGADGGVSVVGMGKVAGRELTYHSDLDLIYLYEGGPEDIAERSRVAQRLIAYLTTMTGAGVAYTVDSRLRPSGRQGMLVTTTDGFERYQRGSAAAWEHMALMRSRVIAPPRASAAEALERVRRGVSGAANPWGAVADMRGRVVKERGAEGERELRFKAGRGGLMDVEFLGTGALLEVGAGRLEGARPAIAAMLRAAAPGARTERLLEDYRLLRRLEARTRWLAGRPVELLRREPDTLDAVADLLEPGLEARAMLERVAAARSAIDAAFAAVTSAGTIRALAG
jgi:glutamate-ammonia-ligase adenylyltransferase